MDLRERIGDIDEALQAALDGRQASMWTALPCTVVSVDLANQTCVLQPTVKAAVRKPDGSQEWVSLPVLQDVPLHFPGGGGVTMTFPIKEGDEALAVISSRPIDSWHQSGGEQQQTSARMHDLSDAMAFVGFRSQPRKLSNVSAESTQIRSDDGQTNIDLHPSNGIGLTTPQKVGISAGNGLEMEINGGSGTATIKGTLVVEGDVIAGGAGGVSLLNHVHTNVEPGAGLSGPPDQ